MARIGEIASAFFKACDEGKGWAACRQYCRPDATFSAQAEPLTEYRTLEQYTEWMKGLLGILPDGRYEVKSFAVDSERNNVTIFGVFYGSHTGPGGPMPPTGKSTATEYVYVIDFAGEKIRHMTKIWNPGWALRELGWS